MMNNTKYLWTRIKINSSQLYNQIKKIMLSKKQIMYLNKISPFNRIKPVYAVMVLALAAGAAFAGLSPIGKRLPEEKSPAQLSVFNNKKSNEGKESPSWLAGRYRQGFRPETGATVSRGGISHGDRYLLARVIEGEAADEPMKGKVAVGAVILNRTESKDFPHDISQVVYQPLAFEAVSNGQYNRPLTPEALKAADLAMEGWDPTSGALYYWNPAKASSGWIWQRPVTMQIGRHVFAR
ncbi:MAG: cell wall hydrolase [Actinobacteria bacterium]|nr:cell wall hydrolase [Actinomycetota bacterium]